MKKIINYIILAMTIVFVLIIVGIAIQNKDLKEEIKVYDNNFKALNLENSGLREEVIAYKFDVEQLEVLNDSIIKDLNNTRKELGIKDKQLKQMQSIKTEIITKDSVFIRDTIFRDNFIRLDTTIKDEWHTVAISLQPDKLIVDAKYKSELQVFASSSREIIGIPKKCWLGRMFQKKHSVIRVDAIDKNPNAIIKEKKFIIIE